MPFDVAFSLPVDERQAFVVALGTLDGQHFDWATKRWDDGPVSARTSLDI